MKVHTGTSRADCLSVSLSDEPSHESRNASTSKQTELQSQASDRRKQNACLSAVQSEVGWGYNCAQELSCGRCVVHLLRARRWQSTRSVGDEGRETCPLCCVAYRSEPILQRAEISTSKSTYDKALSFLHGSSGMSCRRLGTSCIHCQMTPPSSAMC